MLAEGELSRIRLVHFGLDERTADIGHDEEGHADVDRLARLDELSRDLAVDRAFQHGRLQHRARIVDVGAALEDLTLRAS